MVKITDVSTTKSSSKMGDCANENCCSSQTNSPMEIFWGLTVDAGKRYSQVVKQSFQLTMAALEHNPSQDKQFVQVLLQHKSQEFLLCTLQHGKLLQQRLDYLFATGEEVSFSLNGTGVVHLTGFVNPELDEGDIDEDDESEDPDYSIGDDDDEEEEISSDDEDDETLPELVSREAVVSGMKRKGKTPVSGAKRLKLLNESTGDEEEFSDDFGDSDFEEDEDDNESVEESPVKQTSTPKQGKAAAASSAKKNQAGTPGAKKGQTQTPQKGKVKTPAQAEQSTPNAGDSEKKKKKKKKKKNKDGDTSVVDSSGDKSPSVQQPAKAKGTKTTKRVVSGGTVVEDVKVGHGPEAKAGKMVSVYYVGTLAKNNKRFDSCQQGKPFRFRLSQGEVIKGWDTGVAGMKVGGKRKLLIPASQAYGSAKSGPIPANSALQFEVELKAVS